MLEFTQYQTLSLVLLFTFLYLSNLISFFYVRDNLFFGDFHFNSCFWRYIIFSEIHATILGLIISNYDWQIGLLFFFGAFFINVLMMTPSVKSIINIRHNIRYYESYKRLEIYHEKYKEEHPDTEKGSDLND